jgi:mxaA protein
MKSLFALLFALSVCQPLFAAEPIHAINVTPARSYGIVIGDMLTSEIYIAVEPSVTLETNSLPQAGSAVDDILEIRDVQWNQQTTPAETIYHLRLSYQIFKGIRDAETLTVPALPLRFQHNGQSLAAQAPEWHFTLNPIIPAKLADEAVTLQGALPAPIPDDNGHLHGLLAYLAGLCGLVLYGLWRLGWLRHSSSPFKQAACSLKKLRRTRPTLDAWRQGAKLLHTALNETAGHTVLSGQLPQFLAHHPAYASLHTELEQIFLLSDRLFFAEAADYPSDYPLARMETLCRQLAALGKPR